MMVVLHCLVVLFIIKNNKTHDNRFFLFCVFVVSDDLEQTRICNTTRRVGRCTHNPPFFF